MDELPTGAVIHLGGDALDELPAGAAIQPSQMTGLAREIALPATNLAQGALTGVGTPGDLLRTFVHLYSKYVGAPLAEATLGQGKVFSGHNPLDSETLVGAARTLGAVDRPDLQPQNARERYEAAAARGAGAALPLAALGGAGAIPGGMVSGATGGMGAQAGADAFPGSTLAPLIGGLAGGVAGGTAFNAGSRVVSAARGAVSPTVEAYDRLGIPTELAGDVSGSPTAQQVQAFAAKAPGGAGRIEAAGNRVVTAFGDAVERTAANLGPARTEEAAGQTLQQQARNWATNVFPARQAAAWQPVDEALGAAAPVALDNYRTALTDVTGHLGRLEQTGQALVPPRARQLLDALNTDLPAGVPQLGIGATPATWQEAQRLRSLVGEARGVPEVVQAIGDRNLGRIYGALSEDMRATARAAGVEDAFNAANAVSTQGYSFLRNVVGKIFRSPNPAQETVAPEQAARSVLNGGDTTLQAVRAELPQAADDLAAFKLRDMALATPGRQNAGGNQTSPTTYLTDLSNLRQSAPAGTRALFADPQVAQSVDDLATVAHSIRQTAGRLNTSNTAANSALFGIAGGAVPAAYGGYMMGGTKGALAAILAETATPFAVGNLAARSTTNQAIARLLATPVEAPPIPLTPAMTALYGAYPTIEASRRPALPPR